MSHRHARGKQKIATLQRDWRTGDSTFRAIELPQPHQKDCVSPSAGPPHGVLASALAQLSPTDPLLCRISSHLLAPSFLYPSTTQCLQLHCVHQWYRDSMVAGAMSSRAVCGSRLVVSIAVEVAALSVLHCARCAVSPCAAFASSSGFGMFDDSCVFEVVPVAGFLVFTLPRALVRISGALFGQRLLCLPLGPTGGQASAACGWEANQIPKGDLAGLFVFCFSIAAVRWFLLYCVDEHAV